MHMCQWTNHGWYIEGLMQERRNSSALAMELRLSCIDPLICNDVLPIQSQAITWTNAD